MSESEIRTQLGGILQSELRPWNRLHGVDLMDQLKGLTIPIISLARFPMVSIQLNFHIALIPALDW